MCLSIFLATEGWPLAHVQKHCRLWIPSYFLTWPFQPLQAPPRPTCHAPAVPTTHCSRGAPRASFTAPPAVLLPHLSLPRGGRGGPLLMSPPPGRMNRSVPLLPIVLLLLFYGFWVCLPPRWKLCVGMSGPQQDTKMT